MPNFLQFLGAPLSLATLVMIVLGVGGIPQSASAQPSLGDTVYVSPTGSDVNTGQAGFPKRSLQSAVNAAPVGGTVLLAPGVYEGAAIVSKQVTIRGAGCDSASGSIIRNNSLNPNPFIASSRAVIEFTDSADSSILSNIRLEHNARTARVGIRIDTNITNITLEDNCLITTISSDLEEIYPNATYLGRNTLLEIYPNTTFAIRGNEFLGYYNRAIVGLGGIGDPLERSFIGGSDSTQGNLFRPEGPNSPPVLTFVHTGCDNIVLLDRFTNILIANNQFTGTTVGSGLRLLALIIPQSDILIEENNFLCNNSSSGAQLSLENLQDQDTVFVRRNSFTQNIASTIYKGLQIQGSDLVLVEENNFVATANDFRLVSLDNTSLSGIGNVGAVLRGNNYDVQSPRLVRGYGIHLQRNLLTGPGYRVLEIGHDTLEYFHDSLEFFIVNDADLQLMDNTYLNVGLESLPGNLREFDIERKIIHYLDDSCNAGVTRSLITWQHAAQNDSTDTLCLNCNLYVDNERDTAQPYIDNRSISDATRALPLVAQAPLNFFKTNTENWTIHLNPGDTFGDYYPKCGQDSVLIFDLPVQFYPRDSADTLNVLRGIDIIVNLPRINRDSVFLLNSFQYGDDTTSGEVFDVRGGHFKLDSHNIDFLDRTVLQEDSGQTVVGCPGEVRTKRYIEGPADSVDVAGFGFYLYFNDPTVDTLTLERGNCPQKVMKGNFNVGSIRRYYDVDFDSFPPNDLFVTIDYDNDEGNGELLGGSYIYRNPLNQDSLYPDSLGGCPDSRYFNFDTLQVHYQDSLVLDICGDTLPGPVPTPNRRYTLSDGILTPIVENVSRQNPFCVGDTVVLTLQPEDFPEYRWFNGDTTDTIRVTGREPWWNGEDTVDIYCDVRFDTAGTSPYVRSDTLELIRIPLPDTNFTNTLGGTHLCPEDTAQLSVPLDTTYDYVWSNGDTTNSIQISDPDTYSIEIRDTNGCISSNEEVFTGLPLSPQILFPGSTPEFCQGENLCYRVGAPAANQFQWFRNGVSITGANNNFLCVTDDAFYHVIAGDGLGCFAESDSIRATVHPIPDPVVDFLGGNYLCPSQSVTMETGIYASYNWRNGPGNTVSTLRSFTTNSGNGPYTVEVTSSAGCSNVSDPVQVEGPSSLSIGFPQGQVLCPGGTLQVTATVGSGVFDTLRFIRDGVVVQESASLTYSATQTGTYRITGVDSAGCVINTASQAITPFQRPTLSPDNPGPICQNESLTLTADQNGTYTWSTPPGNAASTDRNLIATQQGQYWATLNAGNCSANSDTVFLTVLPAPTTPDIVQPATPTIEFCEGDSAQVCATNGFSNYIWSPAAANQRCFYLDSAVSALRVQVVDANNCTSAFSVPKSVVENPRPNPTITPRNPEYCQGDSVQVESQEIHNTYTWSLNGAATRRTTLQSPQQGQLVLEATNFEGCSGFDTVTVVQHPLPPTPVFVSPTTPAGRHLCPGDSIPITAPAGFVTYVFRAFDGGNYTEVYRGPNNVFWADTSGDYFVEVIDTNGCLSPRSANMRITGPTPRPLISIAGRDTFCQGDSSRLGVPGGFTTYQWNQLGVGPNPNSAPNLFVFSTGDYYVQIRDNFGCQVNSDTVHIEVIPTPTASLQTHTGANAICFPDSLRLTTQPAGFDSYRWNGSFIDTLPHFNAFTSGDYWATIIDSVADLACRGNTDTLTITVNPRPNVNITASGPTTFCYNPSANFVQLQAPNGFIYQWLMNGDSIPAPLGQSQNYIADTTGVYQVLVRNPVTNCFDTSQNSIMVNAVTNFTVTVPQPASNHLCPGDTLVLRANVPGSVQNCIQWNTGSPGDTLDSLVVTQAGVYFFDACDTAGCIATSNTVAITGPIPPFSIDQRSGGALCEPPSSGNPPDTVRLCGVPGFGYTHNWYELNTPGIFSTDTCIAVTTPGQYRLVVRDTFGCFRPSTDTINIEQAVQPTWASNEPDYAYCQGDTIALSVNSPRGITNNNWNVGFLGDTLRLARNCANRLVDSITVTVTDGIGCQHTLDTVVTCLPSPQITLSPPGALQRFCQGDSLVISSVPDTFPGYVWSTGPIGVSSITVDSAANISVEVTAGNGCTGRSDTISTVVDTLPEPTISSRNGAFRICDGEEVVLEAPDTYLSYDWSTGPLDTEDTLLVANTTNNIFVQVRDGNGCFGNSDTVDVFQRIVPPVTIGAPFGRIICPGDSVLLTTPPRVINDFYYWENATTGDTVAQGPALANVQFRQGGQYRLQVRDSSGCPVTSNTIELFGPTPPPQLNEQRDTVFACENDAPTLRVQNPQAFQSLQWRRDGQAVANATQTSYTFTFNSDSLDVHVVGIDTFGCPNISSDTVFYRVLRQPTIRVQPGDTLCQGDTFRVDAGPGYDSYNWVVTPPTYSGRIDSQVINSTLSGIYQVQVSNSAGTCTEVSEPRRLSAFRRPAFQIEKSIPDSFFCEGQTVTLQVDTVTQPLYRWIFDGGAQTVFDTLLVVDTTGTYILEVTDSVNCRYRDSVYVERTPQPNINLGPDDTLCADVLFNNPDTLFANSPGDQVTWFEIATGTLRDTGQIFLAQYGGHYRGVARTPFNCTSSDSVRITAVDTPAVNIPSPQFFCEGSSLVLDAGNKGATYRWSLTDQRTGRTWDRQSIIINNMTTDPSQINGSHRVVVTNAQGCVGVGEFVLSMSTPSPLLANFLERRKVVCADENKLIPATVDLQDLPVIGDVRWNDGDTNRVRDFTRPGIYIATFTEPSGCVSRDTVEIVRAPIPKFDLPTTRTRCNLLSPLTLGVTPEPNVSYQWSTGETTPNIQVTDTGLYSLTVTHFEGCAKSDSVRVQTVAEPSVAWNTPDTVNYDEDFSIRAQGADTYVWDFGDSVRPAGNITGTGPTTIALRQAGWVVFSLKVVKDSCTYTYFDSIYVRQQLTSRQAPGAAWSLEMYPNPTQDVVYVELTGDAGSALQAPAQLILRDLTGKAIRTQAWRPAQRAAVPTQDLAAGTYLLEAVVGDQRISQRIVVLGR